MLGLLIASLVISAALERGGFDERTIRYRIVDIDSGREVASNWPDATEAVPPGSLLKPFAALAFGRSHAEPFPDVECSGQGCWLPSGHGRVGLRAAIAQSCNAYFRVLAQGLTVPIVAAAAREFSLPPPPLDSTSRDWWGLGDGWRVSPIELDVAFRELARRGADNASAEVLGGLADAARTGTAAGVGRSVPRPAFAKTGTAICVHGNTLGRADADGYAVAIYPADQPRYTIVVQIHGSTGRRAAQAGGLALAATLGL